MIAVHSVRDFYYHFFCSAKHFFLFFLFSQNCVKILLTTQTREFPAFRQCVEAKKWLQSDKSWARQEDDGVQEAEVRHEQNGTKRKNRLIFFYYHYFLSIELNSSQRKIQLNARIAPKAESGSENDRNSEDLVQDVTLDEDVHHLHSSLVLC